ncbi:transmembrane protein 150A-like [Salmo trutta]|uniref:transmembrane protein 150A-like n=1 Tax=Salmo trutta TaxID=8032 RepID=UPI001130B59F|nr:transmembrane protein 150A-like [Salmo trutta]
MMESAGAGTPGSGVEERVQKHAVMLHHLGVAMDRVVQTMDCWERQRVPPVPPPAQQGSPLLTPSAPGSSGICLTLPKEYDGTASHCQGFLLQLDLYLATIHPAPLGHERVSSLVSKCGTQPPESCFFSLFCSTGCFMVMLIGLLRYAHIIEKHENCVLNTASLSTGWICAAGLIMVGNFQVDNAKVLHYVGAGVAFPTSILIVCLQSALTHRLAKTHGEYNVGQLRLGMSLLAFISLVLSGVFFIQESFALQHASAIFEWLFCIIIMLFFGTFAFEFGDMSGDTLMVLARGGGVQGFSNSDHKAEEAGGPKHHYQPDGIAML